MYGKLGFQGCLLLITGICASLWNSVYIYPSNICLLQIFWGTGDVVEWYSACLTCSESWVWSPVLQKRFLSGARTHTQKFECLTYPLPLSYSPSPDSKYISTVPNLVVILTILRYSKIKNQKEKASFLYMAGTVPGGVLHVLFTSVLHIAMR